jgi:hypothetical protein
MASDDRAYLYRHTDGSLHRKPALVVDSGGGPGEYFDSPFVKHWWREGDDEPQG